MVSLAIEPILGIGLYTTAEAAFYARISHRKLSRWTFGNANGLSVFKSQRNASEDRFVSFIDFIQALSVRAVLVQFPEIPLPNIREAIDVARKQYHIEFPLAVKERRIFVRGKGLVIDVGQNNNAELIEMNHEHRGQRAFREVVDIFVKNIDFDDTTGLAVRYRAYESVYGNVIMDPKVRMGEPLVAGSGYSANALYEAVKNERGIDRAAKAYGVTENDVTAACVYIDSLQLAA